MRRLRALLLLLGLILLGLVAPVPGANAETGVGAGHNGFTAHADDQSLSDVSGPAAGGGGTTVTVIGPACTVNGPHVCRDEAVCADGEGVLLNVSVDPPNAPPHVEQQCVTDGQEYDVVTPGMVLEAFRRVPLPDSVLQVAPESQTYVNLDTILSTQAEPFVTSVRLLGQRVTLDIEPSGFDWRHGDGTTQLSDTPGLAWRAGVPVESGRYLTHRYLAAETVAASVDTTWSARYRLAGGGWLTVPGTVTIEGRPVGLTVREAPPELHGAN